MLDICGLSAFFADGAAGVTLGAFWSADLLFQLFLTNP